MSETRDDRRCAEREYAEASVEFNKAARAYAQAEDALIRAERRKQAASRRLFNQLFRPMKVGDETIVRLDA